jgi:ubiquinone/menaquinone biosynthesis C-methylase UbiE
MKTPDQKEVWNNIAPEWSEFKTNPAEHVLDFLKDKKGNILDLGSGAGRHLIRIKDGKMYLVDFSKSMIELAKQKAKEKDIDAEFRVANLTKLPFEDNFFDSAIAVAVFHCIEGEKNRIKAAKELFRVLKPGAKAEIAVWNKNTRWFRNSPKERYVGWRDKGKRYYYLFEEKEVHDLFKNAGFKIVSREEPGRMIIFVVQKPKKVPA